MVDWESFYTEFREPGFIPGYEILHRLGGGAFGEVYFARKTSIGKALAIKFLRVGDEANEGAVSRELEQVQNFADIDHPNLVTMEDMGMARGIPFLVMGYAGDETLLRRLVDGRMRAHEAWRTFVQVCRGVQALHSRNLVHFDLKPANIFLKGNVARVGDYGLGKFIAEGRQTLSFGRGTPQYMAPEMLQSRGDHRADIYSLGVILFETLAGRLPFKAGRSGADGPPDFPDGFPAPLREAVERCLLADPAGRYTSVTHLLAAVGAKEGSTEVPGYLVDSPTPSPEKETSKATGGGHRVVEMEGLDPERFGIPETAAMAPRTTPELHTEAQPPSSVEGGARTVPVPPRVSGGMAATTGAVLVLGMEVLGATVTAPFGLMAGMLKRGDQRVTDSLPSVLGGITRFVGFLLVCSLAGASVAGLVLTAFWLATSMGSMQ